MPQKPATGIRLDEDISEQVWVRLAREKKPLSKLVNALLRSWLTTPSTSPDAEPSTVNFQPENVKDVTRMAAGVINQMDTFSRRISELAEQARAQLAKAGVRDDGEETGAGSNGNDLPDAGTTTGPRGMEEGLPTKMAKFAGRAKDNLANASRSPRSGGETANRVPRTPVAVPQKAKERA